MLIRNKEADATLHVDFVPMVDVLFMLLIFFLLATSMSQSEREMRIALPQASASGPISAAIREIIVNIDSSGKVFVAGRETSDEELGSMIRSASEANPDQKVSVRGDRAAAYTHIARVLDVCKASGVQQPFLETVPLSSPH